MRRGFGIFVGIATHLLFFYTVSRLVGFLRGHPPCATAGILWHDGLLAGQFAVAHSFLLHPWTRKRLEPFIPTEFYGCFFCVATCLGLLLMIAGWQSSPTVVWELHGWHRSVMQAAFGLSWTALIYSLSLNGLGYQTGWTPWWHWFRGRALPRRRFEPRGAYRWIRHPVYFCFLGLVWFNPDMTLDRAVLMGLWTVYIFAGSYLKDRRLVYYVGEPYRHYQTQVPGFPGMLIGPLARRPSAKRAYGVPAGSSSSRA